MSEDPVARLLAEEAAAVTSAAVALATPEAKTANYTAQSGQVILADTSAGSWTLTLPATGGRVVVRDSAGAWSTHLLTINGNGANIAGSPTFLADASGFEIVFNLIGGAWRYALTYLYGG
jgi:hypothetical protein